MMLIIIYNLSSYPLFDASVAFTHSIRSLFAICWSFSTSVSRTIVNWITPKFFETVVYNERSIATAGEWEEFRRQADRLLRTIISLPSPTHPYDYNDDGDIQSVQNI